MPNAWAASHGTVQGFGFAVKDVPIYLLRGRVSFRFWALLDQHRNFELVSAVDGKSLGLGSLSRFGTLI